MACSNVSLAPLTASMANYAMPVDLPLPIFPSAVAISTVVNGVGMAVSRRAMTSSGNGVTSCPPKRARMAWSSEVSDGTGSGVEGLSQDQNSLAVAVLHL